MSYDEEEETEGSFKVGADADEIGEPLDNIPEEIFELDEEDPDKDR